MSPSWTTMSPTVNSVARDAQRLGADDGGDAPPAGDDCGVADEPPARGEDALAHAHPVDVLGGRLLADEDHLLASLGRVGGTIRREVRPTHRGTRRRGEPSRDHLHALRRELRVQHLVEVVVGDAQDCVGLRELDVAVLGHVDRHAEGGGTSALADAGLQHPELALLDRELGVAHVAVVRLELVEDREQLLVDRRGTWCRAPRGLRCCGCRRRRLHPARSRGSRRTACSHPSPHCE